LKRVLSSDTRHSRKVAYSYFAGIKIEPLQKRIRLNIRQLKGGYRVTE